MLKYLERLGMERVQGGKGGHQKIRNPQNNAVTVVPVHSKELSKMLEHKIMRELGLK